MAETAVDFLLAKLKQKGEIIYQFARDHKDQIDCLYEELRYLRSTFLMDSEKCRYKHEKVVNALVTRIGDLAYEATDIIDLPAVNHILQKKRSQAKKKWHVRMLSDVLVEIKTIKKEVMEIYEDKLYGIGDPQFGLISSQGSSSRSASTAPNVDEETMVGFDDELENMREQLVAGTRKRLEIFSIVGMAGLGKTTLAKKLYNDEFITDYFYLRGWTYVSQVYQKRDLLIDILSSLVKHNDEVNTTSDEKLGEQLHKCLKGQRYLVVMDDMWQNGAWNDIQMYFPNDNNGSKILFTSRQTEIGRHAKHYHMRFLNEDESWDLFQQKTFQKGNCPQELTDMGKHIAKKCRGLSLAIVVVAGFLAKTEKTRDWWKQVAESLGSHIVSDQEQCVDALALSYNSLPHHLKPCFLCFGAFPEDYEIPVQKLVWLWIAEGFIHQIGKKEFEDVAEGYLMELIDRSLVLVAKRKSNGGIKACRVHDLLHNLCLRKAEEENFLQKIRGHKLAVASSSLPNGEKLCCLSDHSSSSLPNGEKLRRVCVHSSSSLCNDVFSNLPPHLRSFFWCASEWSPPIYTSFIFQASLLLRVLDLSAKGIASFPSEIVELVLLRYLAFRSDNYLSLPESISKLRNLQILIVTGKGVASIPPNIWMMVKLRHLYVQGESFTEATKDCYPTILNNLQTISQVCPSGSWKDVLARTPNLRKLGFCGRFPSFYWFPDLRLLDKLESLKLLNKYCDRRCSLQGVNFPPNLNRLILSNTNMKWMEMSIIGKLPNLEVLKLEYRAFSGPRWKTSDGGFRCLKFLKFYFMSLEEWSASRNHFPTLQQLVLHGCTKLKEIPSELGDIYTLQTIEASWCNDTVITSARQIREKQQSLGNDFLKILIKPRNWDCTTNS